MMTKTQINKLIKMMNDLDYPFEAPLKESFIESIIQIEFNSNSTNCLEKLCNEVSILFKNQPDYLTFLRAMDGFEVNGLRLFSLSIPEPSVKNLFAVNEFYRNNDDFINPDLQERLVIGDDSISIFTYDIKSNFFEIRDNIGTENIFSSFSDFSSFLNEIMDSCYNNQKETKIIVNHAIFLEITSRKFLVRNLAVQAMEKLTTELHSLSEMDRRHVVSILAEIANGYDDFNDMLIYLEFYPNHKILIS